METCTTPKIAQLSVFVTSAQKQLVVQEAKNSRRSVSNFCKKLILEAIEG